jgi:hypothetical protein
MAAWERVDRNEKASEAGPLRWHCRDATPRPLTNRVPYVATLSIGPYLLLKGATPTATLYPKRRRVNNRGACTPGGPRGSLLRPARGSARVWYVPHGGWAYRRTAGKPTPVRRPGRRLAPRGRTARCSPSSRGPRTIHEDKYPSNRVARCMAPVRGSRSWAGEHEQRPAECPLGGTGTRFGQDRHQLARSGKTDRRQSRIDRPVQTRAVG